MRLSPNARYEVDATTIIRLVRLINRTKGLDLKSEELCGFYAGYVYGIAHAVWLTVGGGEG